MLLECDNCSALVNIEVIASYVRENPYDWMDAEKYSFGKCPQCDCPILAKQVYDYGPMEHVDWGNPKKIYPSNLYYINPAIPDKLGKAFIECIRCYKAQSFTATVIMCRRTLEGFCLLKDVNENNLDKSIKKLKELGIINGQLFEWANQLRLAGNEAAHNIDSEFSELDAKDILDFTIAILDFTYSFKDKFDKFKERQAKR